jgi:hypothetical protein
MANGAIAALAIVTLLIVVAGAINVIAGNLRPHR